MYDAATLCYVIQGGQVGSLLYLSPLAHSNVIMQSWNHEGRVDVVSKCTFYSSQLYIIHQLRSSSSLNVLCTRQCMDSSE